MFVSISSVFKSTFSTLLDFKMFDTVWGVTYYGVMLIIVGGIFASIAYFTVILIHAEQRDFYNTYTHIGQVHTVP